VYRSRYSVTTVTVGPDSTNQARYQNPDSSTYACKVKSITKDTAGNLSAIAQGPVNIDWTPPQPISWVNDGLNQDINSTFTDDRLATNWAATIDTHSNVKEYSYAIGTSPGDSDIVAWTSQMERQVVDSGLNLTEGTTYYTVAKATNHANLTSVTATSDGQTYYIKTDISEPSNSPIEVYPVPARSALYINYKSSTNHPLTVQLLNTSGQTVLQNEYSISTGENQLELHVPDQNLAKGVYISHVKQKKRQYRQKLIIKETITLLP
jgi:hypothetical protein